jgi:hypothetical protein
MSEALYMIEIIFNGRPQVINSVHELGEALHRFDQEHRFEVWATTPNGIAMGMYRSDDDAFLMYLRECGNCGFTSRADSEQIGSVTYVLSNGQVDEYPKSWSIGVEQCYKAIAYFFVNGGAKPDWIRWHSD